MNKQYLFFKFLLLAVFIAAYWIFTSSIVTNPQQPSNEIRTLSNKFFPEGWAFFTRDPKEPVLDAYELTTNNHLRKCIFPNGDYMFGASRKSRILGFQLSNILLSGETITWKNGYGRFQDSLGNVAFQDIHSNEKFASFTKGKYILVLTERLPWLWAKNPLNTKIKFRLAAIKII